MCVQALAESEAAGRAPELRGRLAGDSETGRGGTAAARGAASRHADDSAMMAPQELDDALSQGAYTLGRVNHRDVTCAGCQQWCQPGTARAVHLRSRWGRAVYLCLTRCVPKGVK